MSNTYTQDTTSLQVASTFTLPLIVPRISNVTVGNKKPLAVINNESGCSLSITLSGGRVFSIPAGAWTKPFVITQQDISLTGVVQNVLPNSPVNLFSITVYRPEEEVVEPVALGNSPIGISGSVATTSGNSLKNDGNNPPVSIIESTPADQTQSSLSINNDGSGFWQVLSANVLRKVLNIVRGNSGSGKAAITFGDSGDTGITTFYGTIGAGSIVPANTVGTGYPGADVSGAVADSLQLNNLFGAAVSGGNDILIAAQTPGVPLGFAVTTWDGTVAHGEVLVDKNGNFIAGVAPSQILPGGISNSVVIGSTSNGADFVGTGNVNGQSSTGGIQVTGENDITSGSAGVLIKVNNYWDGANDRFIDATSFPMQLILRHDLPLRFRVSGTTPVANGIITWGSFTVIPQLVGSGATGGNLIWEGTTDPGGNASEGDFWGPQ